MLKNTDKLPHEVLPLLQKHLEILLNELDRKLSGLFIHGSAAMGGFTFAQSDLDYLALVASPLTPAERQRLADAYLACYGESAPAGGVEMSIVLEAFAGKDFRYPTPYEFHMGTQEQLRLHARPHTTEMVDPDLAAHFTITKRRGVCVFGKPIEDVFGEVPRQFYLASIVLDSQESYRNIQADTSSGPCVVPRYAVLNFCRVLAFIDADIVASKIEGAQWAQDTLPFRFIPVIEAALQEYQRQGTGEKVDQKLLKEFAAYAMTKIHAGNQPSGSKPSRFE
jgi:streptomycin 3"-adenylyltransferase